MPTTKPRHQITETPAVAHAIDVAAKQWPGESRSTLLLRLITSAGEALDRSSCDAALARQAAIDSSSGKYPAAFTAGYLAELRADWPA
ncbi:MAG: hypothetical protein ACRDPW_09930 [Mycobacteriales bacterium]